MNRVALGGRFGKKTYFGAFLHIPQYLGSPAHQAGSVRRNGKGGCHAGCSDAWPFEQVFQEARLAPRPPAGEGGGAGPVHGGGEQDGRGFRFRSDFCGQHCQDQENRWDHLRKDTDRGESKLIKVNQY